MTRSATTLALLALALLAAGLAGCSQDPLQPLPIGPTGGWEILHPLPGGYTLEAVHEAAPGHAWAVGRLGAIVHWNGVALRRVDSPTRTDLVAVDSWGPDDVYAAGGHELLHFDGVAWDVVDRFADRRLRDIHCGPDGVLYAACDDGAWARLDGAWRSIPGPRSYARTLWTGPGGVVRLGDGDMVWILDGGAAELEHRFAELWIRQGDGGRILAEGPDGRDYLEQFTPGFGWSEAMTTAYDLTTFLDDLQEPFLVTNGGIYQDGVRLWNNDAGRWIYGLAHAAQGGLLACGSGGTFLAGASVDGSIVIEDTSETLGFNALNCFDGVSCDDFWAGEWYDRVLHFDHGAWVRESTRIAGDGAVSAVQDLGDGTVVALGSGKLSVRTGPGAWTPLPATSLPLNAFHAVTSDSIFAGTYNDLLLYTDGEWRVLGPSGGWVIGMDATPSGALYALTVPFGLDEFALKRWDGQRFAAVALKNGFGALEMVASRSQECVWIGGGAGNLDGPTVVYRFDGEQLEAVGGGAVLPPYLAGMTDLFEDELVLLANHEVWVWSGGRWSRESGLPPGEEFLAVWSCPEGRVLVEGQPTYYKDFSQER